MAQSTFMTQSTFIFDNHGTINIYSQQPWHNQHLFLTIMAQSTFILNNHDKINIGTINIYS